MPRGVLISDLRSWFHVQIHSQKCYENFLHFRGCLLMRTLEVIFFDYFSIYFHLRFRVSLSRYRLTKCGRRSKYACNVAPALDCWACVVDGTGFFATNQSRRREKKRTAINARSRGDTTINVDWPNIRCSSFFALFLSRLYAILFPSMTLPPYLEVSGAWGAMTLARTENQSADLSRSHPTAVKSVHLIQSAPYGDLYTSKFSGLRPTMLGFASSTTKLRCGRSFSIP